MTDPTPTDRMAKLVAMLPIDARRRQGWVLTFAHAAGAAGWPLDVTTSFVELLVGTGTTEALGVLHGSGQAQEVERV